MAVPASGNFLLVFPCLVLTFMYILIQLWEICYCSCILHVETDGQNFSILLCFYVAVPVGHFLYVGWGVTYSSFEFLDCDIIFIRLSFITTINTTFFPVRFDCLTIEEFKYFLAFHNKYLCERKNVFRKIHMLCSTSIGTELTDCKKYNII
jgi:hypothetical protein